MEDGRNRHNGARVHRIERVLSENTTMGPRFSNRNAVLNPKSNLEVRSEPQSRAQRRIDESQRGPIAPLSAITGLPCHNRPSMPQQTPQNTMTSQRGPFVSQPHGPWPMDRRVMTLRSNNPMVPLATIALRSCGPRAQVQSCPISLDINPSPTLRINLACLGRKNQPDVKKPPDWVAFKFRWCRRRDLNPHARYVGTSTSS